MNFNHPKRRELRQLAKAAAPELKSLERRLFLRQGLKTGLSLGALSLLGGCSLETPAQVQSILDEMSQFNDWVQGRIFSPNRIAPTFAESDITKPFPFNAFYNKGESPVVDGANFKLELSGMIADPKSWTLDELRALPQQSQITRHICVEGWSAIGKWGVPLRDFLKRIGADTSAKYVGFKCADQYYSSLDMATALHPQTIIALTYADKVLPVEYGFPMKVRVPTKLGFKNPKHIMAMFVTNDYPGGYWEDQGYNWFSGS
jgi:DMSO/TMAO reductase YedYZ molybdopterin-dependent catalytic subunit